MHQPTSATLSIILLIVFISCSSKQSKKLQISDIDLKLEFEQEIDITLSQLGVIDITSLATAETLKNLHLQIAKNENEAKEPVAFILLDKNGNGSHLDYGIDLISLAPTNWNMLNGERFMRLNFVPLREKQSLYLYNHYETIDAIDDDLINMSLAKPDSNFLSFPYTLPDLERTTVNEKTIRFQTLTGNSKLVFFEFWGTWCKPCVKQIPSLKELQNKYNQKVSIVGIYARDSATRIKDATTRMNMTWPQIPLDAELSKLFGEVHMFPLGVLFDAKGKLIRYGISPEEIIDVLSKGSR